MYLGIIISQRFKEFSSMDSYYMNPNKVECRTHIDFCNQDGSLQTICIKNRFDLKPYDLVYLDYVNGNWNIKKIAVPSALEKSFLSIDEILQLDKLLEQEELKLNEDKKAYDYGPLYYYALHFNVDDRQKAIRVMSYIMKNELRDKKKRIEFMKLKENSVHREYKELVQSIIKYLSSNEINLFQWLICANSILHFLNIDKVEEELLIRTMENLLNANVVNNETNSLKFQAEQEIKNKLKEMKGKQKRL